jgi:primosomal protein N' (replication factor Y)
VAGEVLIQTCTPEHPSVSSAARHDEPAFLEHELAQRREAGYPPYRRLVALLFSGKDEAGVEQAATDCAAGLRVDAEAAGVEVLGPAPQAFARLRGQHRWHVLLKGARSEPLHEAARRARDAHEATKKARTVRFITDVDPVEVL